MARTLASSCEIHHENGAIATLQQAWMDPLAAPPMIVLPEAVIEAFRTSCVSAVLT